MTNYRSPALDVLSAAAELDPDAAVTDEAAGPVEHRLSAYLKFLL
jgi:hypothetical protein